MANDFNGPYYIVHDADRYYVMHRTSWLVATYRSEEAAQARVDDLNMRTQKALLKVRMVEASV